MKDQLHWLRVRRRNKSWHDCLRDRLVNRGTIWSHHRRNTSNVKMNDILVAMLALRIKMDCSIPINSIPRCSAIAESWKVGGRGGERHKKQKTRLRAAPSNIEVEQVQIGITQHLLVIVSTTWSVLSKTRHKHATHTSNHTTYQYHYHISLLLILIKGFLISFYYFLILLIKLQYSALAWKLYPLYISAYGASTRSFPFFVIFFELAEKAD